jgi:hypothetical protein
MWSQDIVVSVGYELDDRGKIVWFPAGTRDFFILQNVQAASGAHHVPYSMDSHEVNR